MVPRRLTRLRPKSCWLPVWQRHPCWVPSIGFAVPMPCWAIESMQIDVSWWRKGDLVGRTGWHGWWFRSMAWKPVAVGRLSTIIYRVWDTAKRWLPLGISEPSKYRGFTPTADPQDGSSVFSSGHCQVIVFCPSQANVVATMEPLLLTQHMIKSCSPQCPPCRLPACWRNPRS